MHTLDSILATPPWRLGIFLLELLLAVLLGIWLHITSRKPPSTILLINLAGWGAITAVITAIVALRFSLPRVSLSAQLVNIGTASVLEELAKYTVAAFFLLPNRDIRRQSEAPLYLILIGLGFALAEDAVFLADPSTIAPYRLLSFFLHSGTSAIVGIYFGKYLLKQAGVGALVWGIMSAIFLHFLYDISTLIQGQRGFILTGLVSLLISLQVFLLFRRSVIEEYRQERAKAPKRKVRLLNLG